MSRPALLVFGRTGQLAQELIARAEAGGMALHALGRDAADLTDAEAVRRAIETAPDGISHVINAAAYTAVDAAESDEETALAVNAAAPAAMAEACAACGLGFIHVSTDYVFDGSKDGPYVETDPTGPIGAYGRTKLAGEGAVLAAMPTAVILRTSWVFSPYGKNFLKTMVRLAAIKDELGVVADQHGKPTAAGDLADAILDLANRDPSAPGGIYHCAGEGAVSWHDFAEAIFQALAARGLKRPVLNAITTADFPTPAARPANSVMDCSKLEALLGRKQPSWRAEMERAVDLTLNELSEEKA